MIAANVDTLFIVSGLDDNHNVRRVERYVTQGWESGAVPVVLLNKVDLYGDPEVILEQTRTGLIGVDVHAVRGERGDGISALAPYLGPGKTVAFVGSSGVGTTTLIHNILGRHEMATHEVRSGDSRGCHTRETCPHDGGGRFQATFQTLRPPCREAAPSRRPGRGLSENPHYPHLHDTLQAQIMPVLTLFTLWH